MYGGQIGTICETVLPYLAQGMGEGHFFQYVAVAEQPGTKGGNAFFYADFLNL